MKFLIFNLVVAGALIYLFTADRQDLRTAADQTYGFTQEMKSKARAITGAPDETAITSGSGEVEVPSRAEAAGDRQAPRAGNADEELIELKEFLSAGAPAASTQTASSAAASSAAAGPNAAGSPQPVPLAKPPQPSLPARPDDGVSLVDDVDPEVAARRDLVLGSAAATAPATKPGAARRQELLQLVEEMELFAVEALSQ